MQNEWISFFNPFSELFETDQYPYSRILRTSFTKKIEDAFWVFFGSFNIPDNEEQDKEVRYRLGLIDYATLGAYYLINFVLLELSRGIQFTPIQFTLGFVSLALFIPRLVLASALTLILLPFIGMAQLIANVHSDPVKHKIKEYTLPSNESENPTELPFRSLLDANHLEIETIDRIERVYSPPAKGFPLGNLSLKFFAQQEEPKPPITIKLSIDSRRGFCNRAQAEFYNALRELNVGHLQTKIEAEELEAARKHLSNNHV